MPPETTGHFFTFVTTLFWVQTISLPQNFWKLYLLRGITSYFSVRVSTIHLFHHSGWAFLNDIYSVNDFPYFVYYLCLSLQILK